MPRPNLRASRAKKKSSAKSKQKWWLRRPLLETLEARQMLDSGGLFPGNDCAPDLDLSAIGLLNVQVGEELSLNLFGAGAAVEDLDTAGEPTGDVIRLVLDPDVGTDTPNGATLTAEGAFSWTPTVDQIGLHSLIVIAVDGGSPALADAETFMVMVNPNAPDSPQVDLNGDDPGQDSSAEFIEDGGPVVIVAPGLTVTDEDSTHLAGATVTITNLPDGASESLAVDTSGTSISAGYDSATGVLTLSGEDSIENYQQVLRNLTYDNASQSPDTTNRLIEVVVTDGTNVSEVRTSVVGVAAVNDAPDLQEIADQDAVVGEELSVTVSATDVDGGQTLNFMLDVDNSPAGATIEKTGDTAAVIRWTPGEGDFPGPVGFRVLVIDDGNPVLVDSETFEVAVSSGEMLLALSEGTSFLTSASRSIELGGEQGTRRVSFDVNPSFDRSDTNVLVGDLFQVYLVDPDDESVTLLDRGQQGGSLFSLGESGADYVPGLVTYDGLRVTIDVSSLGSETEGLLVFRLLNGDGDEGTSVTVSELENQTNEEGAAPQTLLASPQIAAPGDSVDLAGYAAVESGSIKISIANVRVDPTTGSYVAELKLTNTGPAVSRALLARLKNLPEGVSLTNGSGVDGEGNPYLNLAPAVLSGGLDSGAMTTPVEIQISNPAGDRFELEVEVLSAGTNRPPEFPTIDDVNVSPGTTIPVPLMATDPDGDTVRYAVLGAQDLPAHRLAGGLLTFTPAPEDVGSYEVTVVASDGPLRAQQTFTLTVEMDSVTTTRISGQIMDSDGMTPLANVPVEVKDVTSLTDENGYFTVEVSSLTGDDAIKVRANEATFPGKVYPFVAEKAHLVLTQGPFANVNNVIARPIYLPALDVAGGTTIDPINDTMVEQAIAPGEMAGVFVSAGSLQRDDGNGGTVPFDGVLSITEVPPALTPAALPPNLLPDVVVTIQPGEMVFTEPAELTLPNRAGYAPGIQMDLWSINPTTGQFDNVGMGQVSPDGASIETISGGVNNSSWHFFAPPPVVTLPPTDQQETPNDCGCANGGKKAAIKTNSEAELHSGALREMHQLVSYQSLGETRGLTLHYNSQRADSRPILHFGADNAQGSDRRLVARLTFERGASTIEVDGYAGGMGLPGGEHFWTLPAGFNSVKAAIQGDLTNQPSGIYDYTLSSGVLQLGTGGSFVGSLTDSTGVVVHVNALDSEFGAGWQLGGVQQLVENPDGRVLFIDGDGANYVFEPAEQAGEYESPAGDFSTLVRNPDGSFTRTTTSRTVYEFDDAGRLTSMTDRNGNEMRHVYDGGRLMKIVDPVGLETTFTYNTQGRVSTITDPANRETILEYDAAGNLMRIIDPDTSARVFEYDSARHLIGETDQVGNHEMSTYGFHGRVTGAVRKDGTAITIDPVQTRLLLPSNATIDPLSSPVAAPAGEQAIAQTVDARGNITTTILDQTGQVLSTSDSEGGLPSYQRNEDNLITSVTNGRGFVTDYSYDEFGNLMSVTDAISRETNSSGTLFPSEIITQLAVAAVATGDFNGDEIIDLAVAEQGQFIGTTIGKVQVLWGVGDGTFIEGPELEVGASPTSITAADFDGDGDLDLATADEGLGQVSVLKAEEDGSFAAAITYSVGQGPTDILAVDIDGDGNTDLVAANGGEFSGSLSVLLGAGDGTYAKETRVPVGGIAHDVLSADFNGDGRVDLATANKFNGTVSVLLAQADGTFDEQPTLGGAKAIAVRDLNGDDRLDLVTAVTDSQFIIVHLGQGDGTFDTGLSVPTSTVPVGLLIKDIDGDGNADLVVDGTSGVSVLFGDGEAAFTEVQNFPVSSGQIPSLAGALAAEDFDGDGRLDLLTGGYSFATAFRASLLLHLGRDDGTFAVADNFPASFTSEVASSGDFDDDGVLDIASVSGFGHLQISRGIGNGTLEAQPAMTLSGGMRALLSADFDGDGYLDLAGITTSTEMVSVLLGNGDGTFDPEQMFAVETGAESLVAGDFDDDGSLDLATVNSNDISVLLGQGNGAFDPQMRFSVGNTPRAIVAGDFDGDGADDLATTNEADGTVTVLKKLDVGGFQDVETHNVGSMPRWLGTADFDRDGILDLLAVNSGSVDVSLLLGTPSGTFAEQVAYNVGGFTESLALGDFTGDGLIDLAMGGGLALVGFSQVTVAAGLPDGGFATPRTFHANLPQTLLAADLNRDGLDDLVSGGSILISGGGGSGPGESVQPRTFTYDPVFNQLLSVTDELGRQTLYEIDGTTGNRISMREVVGEEDTPTNGETDDLVTKFTYTAHGLIDTITDPLDRVTDFDYDAIGRLMKVTFAMGSQDEAFQSFEYDAAGNQTAVVDENGNRTEFLYDDLNRLTQITEADPDGPGPLTSPVTTLDYDERGNLIETVDAASSTTTNLYDALDRLVMVRDELDNETVFKYDTDGNLLRVTDPNGNATRNRYDARSRMVESIDPDGGVTAFRYDADNNLASLTDSVGNRTVFFYDARSRMTREVDPLGAPTVYQYDAVDNLIGTIDRNSRVTQFVYDDVNRLSTETWLASDGETTVNTINYAYDKASNLLSVVDAISALAYSYDDRDRVKQVDNGGTPGAPSVVLDYTYDGVGNVTNVSDTIDGATGATADYTYDALNRTTAIQQTGDNVADKLVDFVYNELGQFDEIARYSDLSRNNLVARTDYAYDELNRLMSLTHGSDADPRSLAFYDFEYDPASRIAAITDIDGRTEYGYDDRDQLTSADRDATDTRGDESYTYDANGNRINSHLHNDSYVTGDANRLLSDGAYNYEYDAEGNMTRRTEIATGEYREFEWDHRNRLTRVTDFSSGDIVTHEVEYSYDTLDRRIVKTVDANGAGSDSVESTLFVYDREDVVLDFVDTDGTAAVEQPAFNRRYLHGPGIDQVLAQENGSDQWLLTDHLGTVRDLVGRNGVVLEHIVYDSFGDVLSETDSLIPTRYLFTGREFDAETGLYYYRTRWYAHNIGRFISEDTIGLGSGQTNFYSYVRNSPNTFTDPSGEVAPVVVGGVVVLGGGVIGGVAEVVGGGNFFVGAAKGAATTLVGIGLATVVPATATGTVVVVAGTSLTGAGLNQLGDLADDNPSNDSFNYCEFAIDTGAGVVGGTLATKIPIPRNFTPKPGTFRATNRSPIFRNGTLQKNALKKAGEDTFRGGTGAVGSAVTTGAINATKDN